MKLTKYEHACFVVEKDGSSLVIDPGGFTSDLVIPENIAGVVVTHQHADHYDASLLEKILQKNPSALVLGPHDVLHKMTTDADKREVTVGGRVTIGGFKLEFFGGMHALIHESMARVDNVGVLINDTVYYPGDSFVTPEKPVDVLALPVAAPWMKISNAIDFLSAVSPRLTFPTHDAILSDAGKLIVDRMLSVVAEKHGITYTRLTETIDV